MKRHGQMIAQVADAENLRLAFVMPAESGAFRRQVLQRFGVAAKRLEPYESGRQLEQQRDQLPGGDAKSSVRSTMFIATRAAGSAKLHRSGMSLRSLGDCRRVVGAKTTICAAPTELGRVSGVVVAINMPLLTELAGPTKAAPHDSVPP